MPSRGQLGLAWHAREARRFPHLFRVLQAGNHESQVIARQPDPDLQVLKRLVQVNVAVRLASVEEVHCSAVFVVLQERDLLELKCKVL